MKRFLFIIIALVLFFLPLLKGISLFSSSHVFIPTVYAQTASASALTTRDWVEDPMVTFLGKTANRATNFMDWMLVNYKWDYLADPIRDTWKEIRNIVYALSLLAIVAMGFLIITNGGKDVGVMIFTKKLIFALILVTFSFALTTLLYQIIDIFQIFFNHAAGTKGGIIIGRDIMNISFPYKDFLGFRKLGVQFDESAFISLIIIQLSSVTFYVIGSILTVRKIILWFFLVASPLFPIVALYTPIKNTVKVWIFELLRWLLYAPLFVMCLAATVIIWKSNLLTLPFKFGATTPLYPSAISILTGGPGQLLSLTNSLNHADTFAQYIVALIMLWITILMPFIILQVLLDALDKYDFGIAGYINTLQNKISDNNFSFLKKPPPPGPLPTGSFSAGGAREILRQKFTTNEESNISRMSTISEQQPARQQSGQTSYTQAGTVSEKWQGINQTQQNNTTTTTADNRQTTQVSQWPVKTVEFKPEILTKATTKLISFPIPTMRDIANFETAHLSRVQVSKYDLQQTQESLKKIADPKASATPLEAQHFTTLREQLNQETTKGDVLAKSILSAASTVQKPRVAQAGEVQAPEAAQSPPVVNLPVVNEIQTVSFDDYDAVKALWLENYQYIDVPEKYSNRRLWIEDDGKTVSLVITLLSSPDPVKVREGLTSVSNILPFLLIGGFSQTEVIAYLKAKQAAGKSALEELAKKEENQETLLAKGAKKADLKELSIEAEVNKKDEKN